MRANQGIKAEHQRKGLTISIVFHATILLLAIIPLIVDEPDFEQVENAIVIDFQDFSSKASGSSSAAAPSKQSARAQVSTATLSSARPVSNPLSKPAFKPVITSTNPDIRIVESREIFFEESLNPVESTESPSVEPLEFEQTEVNHFDGWSMNDNSSGSENVDMSDLTFSNDSGSEGSSDVWSEFTTDGDSDGDNENPTGLFDGDWPGELDGTEGTTIGVGEDGKGKYWGDFAGDGLFNRKVIVRANVARLAEKEGRVVVNLCVNRNGDVVYTAVDPGKSTITDPSIIAKSEVCAGQYVFDQDPTAPEEQCGKLTFVFKIED